MTLRTRIRKRPIRFGFLVLVSLLFVVSIGSFWIGVGYFEKDGYALFAWGGVLTLDVSSDAEHHTTDFFDLRNSRGIQIVDTQMSSFGLTLIEFMNVPRRGCEHSLWIPFGLSLAFGGTIASAAFWWPMEKNGLWQIRVRMKRRRIRYWLWVCVLLVWVLAIGSFWMGAGYIGKDWRQVVRIESGVLHLGSTRSYFGRVIEGKGFQVFEVDYGSASRTAFEFWQMPTRSHWDWVVIPLGLPMLSLGLVTTAAFWWPMRVFGEGQCQWCGYDSRENVSGKCSECGMGVERVADSETH
ncbi:MAG: hypothetical protein IPK83_01895 [Planctomycetes bacterium]|nr:hypothetical protein [Planctomycetota bacterium]